jgi:hypothetical protein
MTKPARKLTVAVAALVALAMAGVGGAMIKNTIFTIRDNHGARLSGTDVYCYSTHLPGLQSFVCDRHGAPGRSYGIAVNKSGVVALHYLSATSNNATIVRRFNNRSSAGQNVAKVVVLHAGDQVTVRGARLACAVSSGNGPRTVICGKGTAQTPLPGTYVLGIADAAALVFKAARNGTPTLVARKTQPELPGAGIPDSTAAARRLTVGAGAILPVAGTHVVCAVNEIKHAFTITCGLVTSPTAATYITNTYFGAVTHSELLLARKLPGNLSLTVIQRAQP